jgi:hypothetical protein
MLLLPILSQEKSGIARTDQRMHSHVWFGPDFVAKAKESYDCPQKELESLIIQHLTKIHRHPSSTPFYRLYCLFSPL